MGELKVKIMNLYELYRQYKTSYYDIPVSSNMFWNPNTSVSYCQDFIGSHYKLGCKETCMMFDFLEEYLKHGKHQHTVSLYLMGMAFIAKNSTLRDKLTDQLQVFLTCYKDWYVRKKDEYNLLYTWYLTALYHDIASCVENIRIPENPTERQKCLEYYLGELDITYSPYSAFPYQKLNIPQRFSENLIKNYFCYRANKGSCEHGIVAGYLFFDRFVKNFINYWKHCQNEEPDEKSIIDKERDLTWNVEQLSHAAYVADAIICHNVWMGGEMDTELYQAYGLSPLLYTEHSENKLSIKNYPLQFMLCLLDTIEPVKRFAKKSNEKIHYPTPREVLENVLLEFKENGLEVSWKRNISEQPEFEYWKKALEDLQNWMEVRCNAQGDHVDISWNTN